MIIKKKPPIKYPTDWERFFPILPRQLPNGDVVFLEFAYRREVVRPYFKGTAVTIYEYSVRANS